MEACTSSISLNDTKSWYCDSFKTPKLDACQYASPHRASKSRRRRQRLQKWNASVSAVAILGKMGRANACRPKMVVWGHVLQRGHVAPFTFPPLCTSAPNDTLAVSRVTGSEASSLANRKRLDDSLNRRTRNTLTDTRGPHPHTHVDPLHRFMKD